MQCAFLIVTGVTMHWIILQIVQSFQYSGIHMNSPYLQLKSTVKKARIMPCLCYETDKRCFSVLPNYLISSVIFTGCRAWLNKAVLFAGAKPADCAPRKLLAGFSSYVYTEQESFIQKESVCLLFCLLLVFKLEQNKNKLMRWEMWMYYGAIQTTKLTRIRTSPANVSASSAGTESACFLLVQQMQP